MITIVHQVSQTVLQGPAGRLWLDRRGVSSAHLALILPVVLGTIMGVIDMSGLLITKNTIMHAANEAARVAMVQHASSDQMPSTDDIIAVVKGSMLGLDIDQAVVQVDWAPEDEPGARVTINVDYPYALSALGLGTVNLKGSSSNIMTH